MLRLGQIGRSVGRGRIGAQGEMPGRRSKGLELRDEVQEHALIIKGQVGQII